MTASEDPVISVTLAVEVDLDDAVVRRIAAYAGVVVGETHGGHGKTYLLDRLRTFNLAARHTPWLVLVDQDQGPECVPSLVARWLPQPAPKMLLRVAVREVEAWLLADRTNLAHFLGVPQPRSPLDPENVLDPKQVMVNLARRSRHRVIQEDMAPPPGTGQTTGRAYSTRLIEFAERHWDVGAAMGRADSLRRCVERLRRLQRET